MQSDEKIYAPHKVVKDTVNILSELNCKLLREWLISQLVDEAYSSTKKEILESVREHKNIAKSLFEELKPLEKGETEESFYKIFDSFEIVPAIFVNEVLKLLKSGKAIEIYNYLVPIQWNKFFALRSKFGEVFNYDSNNKLWTASLKYSSELGLIEEVEDSYTVL